MSCGLSLNYICSQAVYHVDTIPDTMLWVLEILCPAWFNVEKYLEIGVT